MQIVILIRLKMILPATVRSSWRYEKMDSIPHEGKRRGEDQKRRADTAVVVEMLDRVHAEAREGFDVSVTVVERVNILVQGLDMNKPVGKVKVKLPVERDPEECKNEHGHIPRIGRGLFIGHKWETVCCIAVHENSFPYGHLDHSKKRVPHVMQDFAFLVLS